MTRLFACKLLHELAFEQLKPNMLNHVPEQCAMKALSFYHANDCQRHLTGELLARYILRQETGIRPDGPFDTGEKGKPNPEGYHGIHFNISHSGLWVVAATSIAPVGVDVERMRKVPEGVAHRFFSQPEQYLLNNAKDETEKAHIFFTLWTLKESFIKAIGKGLSKSLNTFTILQQQNGEYELEPDPETLGYYLKSFPFDEEYKLAACAAHPEFDPKVNILQMEELLR